MSKNRDLPSLPEIPNLTQDKINRLITADYLETLAEMIRKGDLEGFDLAWDARYQKPVGKVALLSSEIKGPLEQKWTAEILEQQKALEAQIQVYDAEEAVQTHGKCESEACMLCNNPHKA